MSKPRKLMSAGSVKIQELDTLKYPLYASPKLDGIRSSVVGKKVLSRKHKKIRSRAVQKIYGDIRLKGLDGELMYGPPNAEDAFQRTSSAVMSADGPSEELMYYVFDYTDAPKEWGYVSRLIFLRQTVKAMRNKKITVLEQVVIQNPKELRAYEKKCVKEGYEGIMTRDPQGQYKNGRSTKKQGWLLKIKRFEDSEGYIVSIKEGKHNNNKKEKNAFGNSKRSSKKEGMVLAGTAGSFMLKDLKTKKLVKVAPGKLTHDMRKEMWRNPKKYIGKIMKYRWQLVGVKDKPRFPRCIGLRDKID